MFTKIISNVRIIFVNIYLGGNKVKEKLKKYKNVFIFVIAIVLVFALTFLVSKYGMPKSFKEISYEKYLELREEKNGNYVYIGEDEGEALSIEAFAKENDIVIYHLNTSDLTKKQLEDVYGEEEQKSVLTSWQDEEVYSYDGNFSKYALTKDFMKNDFIDTDIIGISVDEYVEIIKEDEYNLMFIGSATCGYCTMFKPELQEVLSQYDVNIYYLDLASVASEDMYALYATDSYFTEQQWGTPLTFLYKNGKRLDVISGYVESSVVIETLKTNKVI